MSIDIFDHSVDFQCDTCGEEDNFEGDLKEACAAAKEWGWQITKEGGTWVHYCPACKGVGR